MATAEEVTAPVINPSVRKWILISALIGYLALLLYLFYFVGAAELIFELGKVNLGIYAFAITSVLISLLFHTLVWYQLLKSVGIKLGFRRTYVLYWVGVFVDNLIPGGWSGDLFKAYLLSRDPNLDTGKAVASVVAKNVYEAIFNLGSMILGLVLLVLNYTFEGSLLITLGGIMLLLTLPLIILLAISFNPEGARKILRVFVHFLSRMSRNRWKLTKFKENMETTIEEYHKGMKILLENPRMFFKPAILSLFAWGFEVITLLFVFASLGQLVPPDKVIIVRSIAGNVEAQGYAFAGYAQIVTSALYINLGLNPALSLSVALLGGAVVFWLKTGISYAAFHCTIFAPCANYVCRSIGMGAANKSCPEKENATLRQAKRKRFRIFKKERQTSRKS